MTPTDQLLTSGRRLWRAGIAATLTAASPLAAQPVGALQSHEPLNPAMVARSGLYAQPMLAPAAGWQVATSAEYGSAIERNLDWPSFYLFDAELLRVQLTARRDLHPRAFVLVQGGVTGTYHGLADGFFEGYHRLIGWVMAERDTRPLNRYDDRLYLAGQGIDRSRSAQPLGPSDLRVALGVRPARQLQTVVAVTLPTTRASSAFARGTPTVSLLHSARARVHDRVALELSAGIGATPTHGELAPVQRTVLYSASGSARLQLLATHALYGTLFHHSAPYRGTGFVELDAPEFSADFGYMWRAPSGREWRIGLTQDLRRDDPGIDLVLKVTVE